MEFEYILKTLDGIDRDTIKSDFKYPSCSGFSFPDFVPRIESKMRQLAADIHVKILDRDKFDSCAKFLYKVILYDVPHTVFTDSLINVAEGQVLSIVRQHPFNDGNKRIGMLTGLYLVQGAFNIDKLELSPKQQITLAKSLYKSLDTGQDWCFKETWQCIIKSALLAQVQTSISEYDNYSDTDESKFDFERRILN